MGLRVGGEDVVVGDDDDLLGVPDLGVLAELLLEDADGARAADVVRHQHVDVDPDVLARLDAASCRRGLARIFSVIVMPMSAIPPRRLWVVCLSRLCRGGIPVV